MLEETINKLGLSDKPSHIWNVDETSFSKDPSKSKVVGCKGFTSTRTIASPGKDNTTVLLGCNAVGEKTPPMIVFKGKNVWDEWTTDEGYPGTAYAATSNGWMETAVFEAFFEKVFLKTVGQKRPILLIYDGHATHVGVNLINKARNAKITILKIPPHTSHLLQPLDLAVNKSFKDKWDLELVKWQRLNIGKPLPKKVFAKLLGQIWSTLSPAICAAGFHKAGIYPLNKNAVSELSFNQVLLQEWKEKTNILKLTEQPLLVQVPHSMIIKNIQSQESLLGRNPDTLLILCLNNINLIQNDCNKLMNSMTSSKRTNKVQILEDKIVTFEDLLLMRIKAGSSSKTKRKRMATGAEVITHDDVYKRTLEAHNLEMEKKGKKAKLMKQEEKKAKTDKKDTEYEVKEDSQVVKTKTEKINKYNKKQKKINEIVTETKFDEYIDNANKENVISKQGNIKQKYKRNIKMENKEIENDIPSNSRVVKKKVKTTKCNKNRKHYSSSSSENETQVKYDESSDDGDFWENQLTDNSDEDYQATELDSIAKPGCSYYTPVINGKRLGFSKVWHQKIRETLCRRSFKYKC